MLDQLIERLVLVVIGAVLGAVIGVGALWYVCDVTDTMPWIIVASAAAVCAALAALFGKRFLEALWELMSWDL